MSFPLSISWFVGLGIIAQAAGDQGGLNDNLGWLTDPRTAVLVVLGLVLIVGGGRRLIRAGQAKRAVERLSDPSVSPSEIRAAAEFGRTGLIDFFRLLTEAKEPAQRDAAGQALARIWKQDDLIPEEEQGVIRRGFTFDWRVRRRYPRGIQIPIPVEVHYGVSFLDPETGGIGPNDLEWSHRIRGAERVALETPSDPKPGNGVVRFTIDPDDYPTNGPHRLELRTDVRTAETLTSRWELTMPAIPFVFEFDPRLETDALLTLPDEHRDQEMINAIRLVPSTTEGEPEIPTFLELDESFALRNPPKIVVNYPIPSDLAHRIKIELEGIDGQFDAGELVLKSSNADPDQHGYASISFPRSVQFPSGLIDRIGQYRLRAILRPDADLGWADPEIRSVWPGTVETNWVDVRVTRR